MEEFPLGFGDARRDRLDSLERQLAVSYMQLSAGEASHV